MTLRHMRIFIVVYQEMNITKASNKLHMTQPAVTRAIKEIETHYDIQLFERLNHKLYRTRISDELYSHALHIVNSFEVMEAAIKHSENYESFRVGASVTLGNFLIPKAVHKIMETHPSYQPSVMISNGETLARSLLDNKIDLAFVEGNYSSDYLRSEVFLKDRLLLIMPSDCKLLQKEQIYMEDLCSYPFLLREKGSAARNFLDYVLDQHGMNITPLWESFSSEAIINAVKEGLGISFLPEQLVKEKIKTGQVATRHITGEQLIRMNYIVWHKNKQLTPSLLEFLQICSECASSIEVTN